MVVMQLGECVQTLAAIDEVVALLQDRGVAVNGLVIKDEHSPQLVAAVVAQANERFSHEAVSWRVVSPLLGLIGTPAVIGVGADGRVRFVDHVQTVLLGGAEETARIVMARTEMGATE